MPQVLVRSVGAGEFDVNLADVIIECDTDDGGSVTLNLPQLSTFLNNKQGKDIASLELRVADVADNAATNNIIINAFAGDLINNAALLTLAADGNAVILTPVSTGQWAGLVTP